MYEMVILSCDVMTYRDKKKEREYENEERH